MKVKLSVLTIVFILTGCTSLETLNFQRTYAEQQAGYSYIPVEPTPVQISCGVNLGAGNNCKQVSKVSLLDSLPDNSVRIATRLVSGSAKVGVPVFGGDIGIKGNTYEVIIDFVNTQTINKQFLGKWLVSLPENIDNISRCYPYEKSVLETNSTERYESWTLRANLIKPNDYLNAQNYQNQIKAFDKVENERAEYSKVSLRCKDKPSINVSYDDIKISPEVFNIPVYIGIGLRLKANVTVLDGEVNLSSLPSLTAAVSAGKATGTMSVQTIGISGKAARSNLLLLDKIDSTTIQNAIQVLASIKSSIESEDTTLTPRIVGFHNTIGAGAQGVNLIHSLLASDVQSSIILDAASYAKGNSSIPSNTGR